MHWHCQQAPQREHQRTVGVLVGCLFPAGTEGTSRGANRSRAESRNRCEDPGEDGRCGMVGRTVSYLRIRQDLACFEVANTQSVWMVTMVSIGDTCSLLLLTGLCLQLKTQMEDCWENHKDDQETAVNGLHLAEG